MKYRKPPKKLVINGQCYPIETDFRVWTVFADKVQKLSDEKLADEIISFISGQGLPVNEESIQAVLDFFSCGEKPKSAKKKQDKGKKEPTAFDFEKDEPLIFAAFMSKYGINLRSIKHLHWWDFMAMFNGLQNEKICEIIGYRTIDTSKMSKEEKARYRKLKEVYSLDETVKHYGSLEERDGALLERMKELQKKVNGSGK